MAKMRYDVDQTTKILDINKQFTGGLKTVDTDDSLGTVFLRDVENVSLSEYGFIERRYGLAEDKENLNFEGRVINNPKVQGYFEYRKGKDIFDQILFIDGRLFLNQTNINSGWRQITSLFKDPDKRYLSDEKFAELGLTEVFDSPFKDTTTFDDNGNPVLREIEATRVEDILYIFTGLYPLKYYGEGVFEPFEEYIPDFTDLVIFSHNLIAYDSQVTYAKGKELETTGATVVPGLEKPEIEDYSFAPYFVNIKYPGSIFTVGIKYNLPNTNEFSQSFTSFQTFDANNKTTGINHSFTDLISGRTFGTGGYLEMYPEVYYRPATGFEDTNVSPDNWIPIAKTDIEFIPRNNLDASYSDPNNTRFFVTSDENGLIKNTFNNSTPDLIDTNRINVQNIMDEDDPYFVGITNMPEGTWDILVTLNIRYSGIPSGANAFTSFNEDGTTNPSEFYYVSDVIHSMPIIIPSVRFSPRTLDFRDLNRKAEALWSCNRVINHYGKLMPYGSLTMPETVFIGHPTIKEYFPEFFTKNFETDQDESIQKITPFMNILVVQSQTYTWGLKGIDALVDASNPYSQFTINSAYGTIAPKSVRAVRNQLYFLSNEGIVSLNSLFANDNQYNIKILDINIENIIPKDPDAVAIQFDDQYWIHFPNTSNNLTLRYYIDKKAWMKDTLFEYAGVGESGFLEGRPLQSSIVFNGIHKFVFNEELAELEFIPNAYRDLRVLPANLKINKIRIDYSLPTDLGETPRALVETSYLDQQMSLYPKKYMEAKLDFTIQNEYNKGRTPIYRFTDKDTSETALNEHIITLSDLELEKNHTYRFDSTYGRIKEIRYKLFDRFGDIVGENIVVSLPQIDISDLYLKNGVVIITWPNVVAESKYILQYMEDPTENLIYFWGGANTKEVVLNKNVTRYVFDSKLLKDNTVYKFRVRAVNDGPLAPWSEVESIRTGRLIEIGPNDAGFDFTTRAPVVQNAVSNTIDSITFTVLNEELEYPVDLYYRLTNQTNFTKFPNAVPANEAVTFTISDLDPATYTLELYAIVTEDSQVSKEESTRTRYSFQIFAQGSLPATPSNLELLPLTYNETSQRYPLLVRFQDNATNESRFIITVTKVSGSAPAYTEEFIVPTLNQLIVEQVIQNLYPLNTYEVRVLAENEVGQSDEITDQILIPDVPALPQTAAPEILLVGNPTSTSVAFNVKNTDVSNATIFYGIVNPPTTNYGTLAANTTTSEPISITDLNPATNYTLYVSAEVVNKTKTISTKTFTTASAPVPVAPLNLSASATSSSISGTWSGVENAATYELGISTVSAASSPTVKATGITTTSGSFSTSGLTAVTQTYYLYVRGRNSTGASGPWSTSSNAFTIPAPPAQNYTYRFYYILGSASAVEFANSAITGPTGTQLVYPNVPEIVDGNNIYTFQSWNTQPATMPVGGGSSTASYVFSGTVPTAPATPASATISSPADNTVNLVWSSVSGATSYEYQVYSNGELVVDSSTSGTSISNITVNAGSAYFRVRAVNSSGSSSFRTSNTITVGGLG